MARYFLDSSALVKQYHAESGSTDVQQLFSGTDKLAVSRLAIVELNSSLARLVREGRIQRSGFESQIASFEADVANGRLRILSLSRSRLDEAAALLASIGLAHNLRTLDALHLATAEHANRQKALTVVAADRRLLDAAQACGRTTMEIR